MSSKRYKNPNFIKQSIQSQLQCLYAFTDTEFKIEKYDLLLCRELILDICDKTNTKINEYLEYQEEPVWHPSDIAMLGGDPSL